MRISDWSSDVCSSDLPDLAAANARLTALLDKNYPALDALYKDLHQHPELGMQEVRTAGILAQHLRDAGFTVTEKVGGTGVVGLLKNGAGPTLLVRADLDEIGRASCWERVCQYV